MNFDYLLSLNALIINNKVMEFSFGQNLPKASNNL